MAADDLAGAVQQPLAELNAVSLKCNISKFKRACRPCKRAVNNWKKSLNSFVADAIQKDVAAKDRGEAAIKEIGSRNQLATTQASAQNDGLDTKAQANKTHTERNQIAGTVAQHFSLCQTRLHNVCLKKKKIGKQDRLRARRAIAACRLGVIGANAFAGRHAAELFDLTDEIEEIDTGIEFDVQPEIDVPDEEEISGSSVNMDHADSPAIQPGGSDTDASADVAQMNSLGSGAANETSGSGSSSGLAVVDNPQARALASAEEKKSEKNENEYNPAAANSPGASSSGSYGSDPIGYASRSTSSLEQTAGERKASGAPISQASNGVSLSSEKTVFQMIHYKIQKISGSGRFRGNILDGPQD